MDAIKLLEKQHREVDTLIGKIEKARKADRKAAYFREMADALAAHVAIEERIFYPAIKAAGTKVHDMVMESVEEHLAIKRVLADLLAIEVSDDSFTPKLKVLQEELQHHAHEEEEDKLFPRVAKAFEPEQLLAMGAEMEAMYDALLAGEPPSLDVPNQTDTAATV